MDLVSQLSFEAVQPVAGVIPLPKLYLKTPYKSADHRTDPNAHTGFGQTGFVDRGSKMASGS